MSVPEKDEKGNLEMKVNKLGHAYSFSHCFHFFVHIHYNIAEVEAETKAEAEGEAEVEPKSETEGKTVFFFTGMKRNAFANTNFIFSIFS